MNRKDIRTTWSARNQRKWRLAVAQQGLVLLISAVPLTLAACSSVNSPGSISTTGALSPDVSLRANSQAATPAQRDIVFLHHSVGRNLIDQGGLRQLFTSKGYAFYDQGYNVEDGLHLPDGTRADYNYNVPGDNTDPDGLADVFSQPVDVQSLSATDAPSNTLTGLLRHNVIMFKSCYPVTLIESDADLEQYKAYYLQIRATIDKYPNHVFVALTPPPLEPGSTTPQAAARARAFANWMKSQEFLGGRANLFVVDFFNLLAQSDPHRADFNTLRADYRIEAAGFKAKVAGTMLPALNFVGLGGHVPDPWERGESHPNARASQAVSPVLAEAVDQAVVTFSSS